MSARYDVEGLVVVVMGGTTGLGLSAAQALVANGAKVVVTSRSEANVQAALDSLGENARGFAADASLPETAERAVALAVEAFGRLDALYHVAGGSGRAKGDGPLHEITDEGLRYTLDLNLTSLIASNRAAVKQFMKQGGGGCILNMGSVLGWSPSPEFFASHAYAAAKAGIVGFSRSIASYYAPQNIRVNVIAPALVETPMSQRAVGNEAIVQFVAAKQPLDGGRVGSPADVEGAALFLLSRAAQFITGQVLAVDGGWTVSEGREAPNKKN
ncbi:NAD(P)-dependent dehydrogenase (short-subunit alcohol dehydrogenase family) [Prosthecobacter fusiformis]|uniref:NAD(P)-dependent dehydrogenase (Short-subunit alcohol dehydrogenase family) n=1 Tax=Prosthecobacter fusiformis TaxID=48464 RepID=A0A4V3FE06_9BACT|nr:SDR family oxidoreductase [Prosthecobacter fusiformis]TDU64050.1 NAD(P)-dependent dehydrogenase (short-subunit alcohol dehydrogenase family) [Prosthecobacter fusiformis]